MPLIKRKRVCFFPSKNEKTQNKLNVTLKEKICILNDIFNNAVEGLLAFGGVFCFASKKGRFVRGCVKNAEKRRNRVKIYEISVDNYKYT